jgi:hypothetical protein
MIRKHMLAILLGVAVPMASGLVSVDSSQDVTPMRSVMTLRVITDRTELRQGNAWTDVSVQLVSPGRDGAPTRVGSVAAKAVSYQPSSHAINLAVVYDSDSGYTHVVRGQQTFYVAQPEDMFSCGLGPGVLYLRRSIFKARAAKDDVAQVIAQFVSTVDDAELFRVEAPDSELRIDLRMAAGVPFEFWTAGAKNDQPASPTILGIDVTGTVLRLDLESPSRNRRGSFWVELKEGRLLRASIGVPAEK